MNHSETEIEKKLVEACKLLPGQLEQLCDTIVLLYGHEMVEYILKYETPSIVCKQIGLCSKAAEVIPVVELAEDYIKGNATHEKVKKALEKVCDKLGPFK